MRDTQQLDGRSVVRVHYAILTHNRPPSLSVLLQSIAAQTAAVKAAITILDNGSTDDHAASIRRLSAEHNAAAIRSESNTLMAGRRILEDHVLDANELDVLVHLDDDVVLSPGWLSAVIRELDAGSGACGSVQDDKGDVLLSGQRTVDTVEEHVGGRRVGVWDMTWQSPQHGVESEQVEFAGHRALAVKADVARVIRHDASLTAGGDDIDYSLALCAAGNQLRISHGAIILHRSMGEADISQARSPESVLSSWRHFHAKWGFIRRNASVEAGIPFPDFVAAVVGSPAPPSAAVAND